MRNQIKWLGTALFSVVLAACGGGGAKFSFGDSGNGTGNGSDPTGVPAGLTLSVAQPQIVANGVATTALRATLLDTNSQPISGNTLNFTTTAGTLSAATATTDSKGEAIIFLKASTTRGQATVTVTEPASGVSGTGTVQFISGAATQISLTASPTTVAPNKSTSITVTVKDASNNPVAGKSVQLKSTSGTGTYSSATGTTDTSGTVTATFTPSASTSLTATLVDENITSSAVAITVDPNAAVVGNLIVTAIVPSANADGSSTVVVRATVTDVSGAVIPSYPVNFTTVGGAPTPASATVNTLANGNADFSITSTTPGSVTVGAATGGTSRSTTVTFTGNPAAATLTLLADTFQLKSNAVNTTDTGVVKLSAVVKDANNNIVQGQPVTFKTASPSDTAQITVTQATTDATGQANAILTTGGDPRNRPITVIATAGGTGGPSANITVQVTGTSLTLVGNSSSQIGQVETFTATLTDNANRAIAGRPVTFSSANGNIPANTSVTTSATGQAIINVTLTNAGMSNADTITASALPGSSPALTTSKTVSISTDNFVLSVEGAGCTTPAIKPEIALGIVCTVRAHWDQAGTPVPNGTVINFTTTKGTLSASSAMISGGDATVTIAGAQAGVATLVASSSALTAPTASKAIEFVATTPTRVDLQPDAGVIATSSSTLISAVVRDANNNLVKNQVVEYSLSDITGGSLSSPTGTTDSQGLATVTYTASTQTSATNGVTITGHVRGTPSCGMGGAVCGTTTLTVGSRAVRIQLVTGNVIRESSETTYALPYSAFVTDAAGNPISGTLAQLSVEALSYRKGCYRLNTLSNLYEPTDCQGAFGTPITCPNEDVIPRNGILDAGEDTNTNGRLEPGTSASVPSTGVVTGSDPAQRFDVTYGQDRANWVTVRLTARVTVSGTETVENADFLLPVLKDDVDPGKQGPPAGFNSPYGIVQDCTMPN